MARRPETLGSFAADLVTSLGGKPSKASTDLFNAWQRWEGGWSANEATYNPLNTTKGKYRKINSVGVSAFPDYQTGIAETVATLGGYPAISQALRSGQVNFQDPALQADFNRWLTGKRTPGMSAYVSKIAGSLGQGGGGGVPLPGAAATPAPAAAAEPFLDPVKLSHSIRDKFIQGGGTVDLTSLPGSVRGAWTTPSPATLPVQAQAQTPFAAAGPGGDYSKWVGKVQQRQGPSAPHTAAILNFVGKVGQVAGEVLTPWGNESHSLTTVNGNRSAHADGMAADIPSSGTELIRRGRAALIAAGMPPAQAAKAGGGLYNIGGYQVIFATNEGGNHWDHVHVGIRGG